MKLSRLTPASKIEIKALLKLTIALSEGRRIK